MDGKAFDAGKEGFNHFADALPTGNHWAPGVAFTASDVEALKNIGGRIGAVGSVLKAGRGAL